MRPFDPVLLRSVPQARVPLLVLSALGVLEGVLAVGQALILAWLVADVATGAPVGRPALVLVLVLALRGLVSGASQRVTSTAGQQVAAAIRARLLRRWLRCPEERRPTPDTAVTRATEGAATIEPYVSNYLPSLVSAIVVPGLAVVTLALVDVWSALIVVLTLPLMPLFAALIGRHTQDETDRRWAALTRLAGHFLDVVQGLPTLVAYGRARHQIRVVAEVGERHRRATVRTLRTAFMSTAALELLATISVAMVAVAVGLRLAAGWMELPIALAAILLAPEAYWPIRKVGAEFHNAADGSAAFEAMSDDLTANPDQSEPAETPPGAPKRDTLDAITITGLQYAYPGREPVVSSLDLATAPGPGLTALTGPSGSGKSTLLDLLAGIREPSRGQIHAPAPAHYATQRALLVPGTVRENVTLGAPAVTDSQARAALEAVGLWPDLAHRQGLDTWIGDDGFGLSAGQRTRLALARAQLSDAPMVLLDEPTAHVASSAVSHVHAVIRDLASRKRVVVVTHSAALAGLATENWRLPATAPVPHDGPIRVDAGDSAAITDADRPDVSTPAEPARPALPRRRLLWACLFGGLSTTCGVALTATSGWLIVQASFQPVILTLLVAIVAVRAFGIGRPLLRYAERVFSHDVALSRLMRHRTDVFRRLIPLTPARLGRRSRNDMLTAVVRDLDEVSDATARVTVPLWSAAIASAAAVAILALVLPAAAGVVGLATVVMFVLGRIGQSAERRHHTALVAARGRVHRVATLLSGRLSAYGCVMGGRIEAALKPLFHADHEHAGALARISTARSVITGAAWFVLAACTGTVAWLASAAFGAGTVTAPTAALITLTPITLADTWVGLADAFGARARAQASAQRLDDLLRQRPAVSEHALVRSDDTFTPQHTTVDLRGVTARWADEGPVDLRPLDLALRPGGRILMTGANGSGKSTALAVLARHLDPICGEYSIDSVDIRDIPLAAARSGFAPVDDEPHVFAGTVRANMLLARPDASDAQIRAALNAAGLRVWFSRLPGGLDTAAMGVSGGERVRFSIARAILSGRRMLLLDEPTAHLDPPTSRAVLNDLLAHAGERTIVLVSHEQPSRLAEFAQWQVVDVHATHAELRAGQDMPPRFPAHSAGTTPGPPCAPHNESKYCNTPVDHRDSDSVSSRGCDVVN